MIRKLLLLSTATAAILAGTQARAADIYHQDGGLKDGGYSAGPSGSHTGWAIRGFVGYATGDRDIDSDAHAFLNCTNAYDLTGLNEVDRAEAIKDIEANVAELNKYGVFATNTTDGTLGKVVLPLLGAFFNNSDTDDFNSFVFGGEVEHLWHSGQWGIGLALGVTVYGDAESKTSFAKLPTFFERGTLSNPNDGANHGQNGETGLTVSGYASVDREFDIDPVLKLYYFAGPDLAFHLKAGPSFARAKVKGGVSVDGTDVGLAYEKDDTSIGVVLGGGVTKWWSQSVSTTIEGDWKKHNFNANGSHSESLGDNCYCDDVTVDAKANTDVEDSVWTIKGGVAYHW